jgi:adenylate cyclase
MSDTAKLHLLEHRLLFQRRLDEFLESAGRRRVSLATGLGETLPLLLQELDADMVWIETWDESLEQRTFTAGLTAPDEELTARARELVASGKSRTAVESGLVACRLDVAGEHFGTLAARCLEDPPRDAHRQELLQIAAEVFDNYLAAIRDAREKQRLLRAIHESLSQPVVHTGVRDAVRLILDTVEFDLLIVIYHIENDYRNTCHYLVFRGKELEFSNRDTVAEKLDRALHDAGLVHAPTGALLITNAEVEHRRVLGQASDLEDEDPSEELLSSLGYHECLETMLITGMHESRTVGKLVVGSRRPLSTYERDVFDLFSDVLQKRITDFSSVGKLLHRTFSTPVVLRLLDDPSPTRFLTPRAEEISILFADVVSFTRISEQVVKDPVLVGKFIEEWSRGATQALWEHGGVFDKLVGDCAIGLFGPPLFESSQQDRAVACARAAVAIIRFTHRLLEESENCERIRAAGEKLTVAIGINDCPASVGQFGLNQDYTAFSPGMNNTARLQSLAGADEVFVMAPMKALLEKADVGFRFGERCEGAVKNVAEPLVYYPLVLDSVK